MADPTTDKISLEKLPTGLVIGDFANGNYSLMKEEGGVEIFVSGVSQGIFVTNEQNDAMGVSPTDDRWGLSVTGTASANVVALQTCLDFCATNGYECIIPCAKDDSYDIDSQIIIPNYSRVRSVGAGIAQFNYTGPDGTTAQDRNNVQSVFKIRASDDSQMRDIVIEGIRVDMNIAKNITAFEFYNFTDNSVATRLEALNIGEDSCGFWISRTWYAAYNSLHCRTFDYHGLKIAGSKGIILASGVIDNTDQINAVAFRDIYVNNLDIGLHRDTETNFYNFNYQLDSFTLERCAIGYWHEAGLDSVSHFNGYFELNDVDIQWENDGFDAYITWTNCKFDANVSVFNIKTGHHKFESCKVIGGIFNLGDVSNDDKSAPRILVLGDNYWTSHDVTINKIHPAVIFRQARYPTAITFNWDELGHTSEPTFAEKGDTWFNGTNYQIKMPNGTWKDITS